MFHKIKKYIISTSINFPKTIIIISFLLRSIIISGMKHIVQDDDMVRLLPKDIPSIVTFNDITDEFGNYEFMYVAMGIEGVSALNKDFLKIVWDISNEFEKLEECEEVISVPTMSKTYFDLTDSSIVVNDLMPQRLLNDKQILEIETYLDNNPEIKSRVISKNEDYLNIIIRPRDNHDYPALSYAIHEITDKYKNINNLKFHYGGQAYVTGAVPGIVAKEVKILLIFGLFLMTIILLVNLRSIKGVFRPYINDGIIGISIPGDITTFHNSKSLINNFLQSEKIIPIFNHISAIHIELTSMIDFKLKVPRSFCF